MLNEESLRVVDASIFSKCFRAPLSTDYTYRALSGTIESLCGLETPREIFPDGVLPGSSSPPQRIVVILIDGFGWRFFDEYRERYPFLRRVTERGCVSKITSLFPSTTSVHIPMLHFGCDFNELGITEWFHYEPRFDSVIIPLLNSYAGDRQRDTLLAHGLSVAQILPESTLYQRLASNGVPAHVFMLRDLLRSTFSELALSGAEKHGFDAARRGLRKAADLLAVTDRAYVQIYIDDFDAACHRHGPQSPKVRRVADRLFSALEEFVESVSKQRRDTLVIVTADHGETEINPMTTHYVDGELPALRSMLKTTARGTPIAPTGAPRDQFLHVRPEHREEALRMLREKYGEIAEIYPVDELIAAGIFGKRPLDESLRAKLGDLVILPYRGESIWWWGGGRFGNSFSGHHGGLTPEEMDSVLMALHI